MADAHKNFATSLVATAPSPAASGTSLVVTTGEGTRFPAVPFNATVCPADAEPTPANAEIVRVTAGPPGSDTFTIVRTQESSSARTIVVGDRIFAGLTAGKLNQYQPGLAQNHVVGQYYLLPPSNSGGGQGAPSTNRTNFFPVIVEVPRAFDRIACYITTNGTTNSVMRMGIWHSDSAGGMPGTLLLDAGTVAIDAGAAAIKHIVLSPTLTLQPGMYWMAGTVQVAASGNAQRVTQTIMPQYLSVSFSSQSIYTDVYTGAYGSNPTGLLVAAIAPQLVALRAA